MFVFPPSLLWMLLANALRGIKKQQNAVNRLGFVPPWGKGSLEKFPRGGANRRVGGILEGVGTPQRRFLFRLNVFKAKGDPQGKPYYPVELLQRGPSQGMKGTKGEKKTVKQEGAKQEEEEKKDGAPTSKKKINKKEKNNAVKKEQAEGKKTKKEKKNSAQTGETPKGRDKPVAVYPPIPKSLDDRWNDFRTIEKYTEITNVYLGAHISAGGGVQNAPTNCFNVAGQAFALFLKNQRKWESPSLSPESIKQFEQNCKAYKLDAKYILPHGSYLINLANPDGEKREKSYLSFLDDVRRCEQLNIPLYNFHPGSTTGMCSLEEGIKNVADCINRVHKETSNVVIVLENSAGQKNSVGSKFEDLKNIISLIEDKSRIGVCLDTCHTFAAGYDIRSYNGFDLVMKQFDEIIDASYLKAVHLNDSKSELGSGLDRHENIGKGKLSLETFKYVMTARYFKNIPIILETPDVANDESVYKYEIRFLYEMVVNNPSGGAAT
ncbi:apurinic/apyrimidinic endonuclease Apn1, putative [Plasmodium vivax]|nr:unnamed protein product [Plasmodium vivax]CAI7722028.1 DNA-(apurinic or apyrimidinic site) lyase 1, putative [Plasmodium vivax]SCO74063.1 apurinic/apyrimidinic endonuclease Apn1, putative [Plasmodium vivax]VUZ97495.1 DNA-(apurinic or apyrimidinic site) lyase 1, putative [Plasmodium vivax]